MKQNHPPLQAVLKALDVTWPPAHVERIGAWTIRDGQGGGKRVSAASENWPTTEADLPTAEHAMQTLGIDPLFQIHAGDEHLDHMLAQHGYDIIDPVNIWVIDVDELTKETLAPVSSFAIWPPLAIMKDLWEKGDIGAERLAVMDRAPSKKAALLARINDTASGVAFVAMHDNIAMVHAIHVDEHMRRKGAGRTLVKQAAHWAKDQGAQYLTLIVTQGNHAANPLYTNLGMHLIGHYHYRVKRT